FEFSSYFFFSSRRRHTRFSRDWSSDVCSSDLLSLRLDGPGGETAMRTCTLVVGNNALQLEQLGIDLADDLKQGRLVAMSPRPVRSEERRVGKECKGREAADADETKRRDREINH